MGVMYCHRKDCGNIMCDTYVENIGYICDECQSDFKQYLEKNELNPTTEGEIKKELKIFMDISKHEEGGVGIEVGDFFIKHTINNYR